MRFVAIHSLPSPQGAAHTVTPATGPDDNPPYSIRFDIDAVDQTTAEAAASDHFLGRPGETHVFPVGATLANSASAVPGE